MKFITLDEYIVTVLMRDLAGHDRNASAYLVFLHLASESEIRQQSAVRESHQTITESTGLSKSAVQKAIRYLRERKLIRVEKESPTAVPEYSVQRTWRR